MSSKSNSFILNKEDQITSSTNEEKECIISKASNEIMLNRVCEGNILEFPFGN